MRESGAVWLLVAGLVLFATGAVVAEESSPTPPKNLKLVGDHWTPWDPPAAGPDAYIIVKGDTLWDLSEKWLGDPFLWPQIWDENRYILDSHWIYPGDPLVIPGRPTVVPGEGELPVEEGSLEPEGAGEGEGGGEATTTAQTPPAPPPLVPVAGASDVYCSGYIEPEHDPSDLWVAGRELEGEFVAEGDVVYLSQGRNHGIQPGDEFAVVRNTREIKHPETGDEVGTLMRRLGRARVMLVQDNTSTAVIDMSCAEITDSDELLPWEEIPIPRRTELPAFDRYDVTESGGPQGFIVTSNENIYNYAAGHIIHTDLGVASGVSPGDVLTLYRDNGELPRAMLGQAVVLTVEPKTSTAKITFSVRESERGDRVEVRR